MRSENDRYSRIIEWDETDQCFVGRCPELFLGGCHGSSRGEVESQLQEIINDVIQDYKNSGKQLPPAAKRSPRFNAAIEARRRTGLSQKGFARAIGVGLGTIRNWEQGRVMPKGTAATLLRIVEKRPDILGELVHS